MDAVSRINDAKGIASSHVPGLDLQAGRIPTSTSDFHDHAVAGSRVDGECAREIVDGDFAAIE